MANEVNGVSAINTAKLSAKTTAGKVSNDEQTFKCNAADTTKGTTLSNKKARTEQVLKHYGIDTNKAEWVGIDFAEVVPGSDGKQLLVLRSNKENYQLELPVDDNFRPDKINMWRAEDQCNIHFEGINGILRIKGTDTEAGFTDESTGFAFHKSNVEVFCKDGMKDNLAMYKGSNVKVHTGDYRDTMETRGYTNNQDFNLRPGTTTFRDKK